MYSAARPIVLHMAAPVLEQAVQNNVNGSVSWDSLSLTPAFDFQLNHVSMKDAEGRGVLKSSQITVYWSLASMAAAAVRGRSSLYGVDGAEVDSPELTCIQNKDGTWNTASVLRNPNPGTKSDFRGKVILKDGKASAYLCDGEAFRAERVNGALAWDDQADISGELSAVVQGTEVTARGNYQDAENFSAELKSDGLALSLLQPYILQSGQNIQIGSGMAKDVSAKVQKTGGTLACRAEGTVENGDITAAGHQFSDIQSRFHASGTGISLTDLSFAVDGQLARGSLSANWSSEDPSVQGDLEFNKADMQKLAPGEDISGTLSGTVHLDGTFSHPVVSGKVSVKAVSFRGSEIEDGTGSFIWQDGKISFRSLFLHMAGGTIQGKGSYDTESGQYDLSVAGNQISLERIPNIFSLSGTISGRASVQGNAAGIESVSGDAEGTDVSYDGISAGHVSALLNKEAGGIWHIAFDGTSVSARGAEAEAIQGYAEGDGDHWTISYLNGKSGDGAFSLSGSYEDGSVDLFLRMGQADLGEFAGLAGVSAQGRISLNAEIRGPLDAPAFSGSFHAEDGNIRGMHFDSADGELESDGTTLTISSLRWREGPGYHDIRGTVGIRGDHALHLTAETEKMRIENLMAAADTNLPVTGWLSNRMTVSGTLSNPELSGTVHVWDGSILGELFENGTAQYRMKDGIFYLDNSVGYIYKGAVHATGYISTDSVDVALSVSDMDLGRLFRDRDFGGSLSAEGRVTGTLQSPSFDGGFYCREITLAGSRITDALGRVSYSNRVIHIDHGRFRQGNGEFIWNGNLDTDTNAISGELNFSHWNIPSVAAFLRFPIHDVTGEISGSMALGGTIDSPDASAKFQIENGMLGDTAMGTGSAELTYRDHVLDIHKFRVPVGQGVLAVKGNMQKDGSLDMEIGTDSVDISWIPAVLLNNPGTHMGGTLTTEISLRGTVTDPEADVSVSIDHPVYDNFSFDHAYLMANVKDNTINFSQGMLTRGIYKASLYGSMPVNFITRKDTENPVPLDLSLNLDNADLNLLTVFFKQITSASGAIKGGLKLTGPWNDPQLTGTVQTDRGMMTVGGMSTPILNIGGTASFQGKSASFSGGASVGGGRIEARGNAAWDKSALSDYKGTLTLASPSVDSAVYKGKADGNLQIEDIDGKPKLSGDITLHHAVMDVPYQMALNSRNTDILLDVRLKIGSSVRLYNKYLYDIPLSGAVTAAGSTLHPEMSGKVEAVKGQVRYLYNEFNVEHGEAVWGGMTDSFLPILHVLADTHIGHYYIGMEVNGPPTNIDFRLKSDPHLSDQQIMMLLTLNQDPTGESVNTGGALLNAGLQLAFSGGIQNALRNTFGLDMITMTTNLTDSYQPNKATSMNDNYYYVKIGKYLFNNFMLTATSGLNNSQKSIGARYDLGTHFGLSTWYNNEHNSYVGVDWKFNF